MCCYNVKCLSFSFFNSSFTFVSSVIILEFRTHARIYRQYCSCNGCVYSWVVGVNRGKSLTIIIAQIIVDRQLTKSIAM